MTCPQHQRKCNQFGLCAECETLLAENFAEFETVCKEMRGVLKRQVNPFFDADDWRKWKPAYCLNDN